MDQRTFKITGSISELTDFNSWLLPNQSEMTLNCRAIYHVNSCGVRAWIEFLKQQELNNCTIILKEVSEILIDHMNLFPDMIRNVKIESVALPLHCHHCHSELSTVIAMDQLRGLNPLKISAQCCSCGKNAELDDAPDQYFRFLNWAK